jgi:alkylmercury lyase
MAEVADEAGVQVTDLIDAPAGRDIEYDNEHRIVGWGLTLIPTPHAFVVDGRRLYTWCAAHTLLFPAIIGWPVTAVISVPGAVELDPARVRASCCNPGRFFAIAALPWTFRFTTLIERLLKQGNARLNRMHGIARLASDSGVCRSLRGHFDTCLGRL